MISLNKLFIPDSNPLQEVETPEPNGIYHNEDGHRLRFGNDPGAEVEVLQRSPLNDGHLITDLDEKMLDMFWTLRKNDIFYKGD